LVCYISDFCLFPRSFGKKLIGRACPPSQVSASAYSPRLTSTAIFRSARRKTGQLTTNPLFRQDAHRIIRRRGKAAGIETRIGNHTFRATGTTAYLKKQREVGSSAADRKP
jgi:integrase